LLRILGCCPAAFFPELIHALMPRVACGWNGCLLRHDMLGAVVVIATGRAILKQSRGRTEDFVGVRLLVLGMKVLQLM
jgi:hypothetical protein